MSLNQSQSTTPESSSKTATNSITSSFTNSATPTTSLTTEVLSDSVTSLPLGQQNTVFGFQVTPGPSAPIGVFPNDTLIWTNYVLKNSAYIDGIETVVVTANAVANTTVIMAVYINSEMTSQSIYHIKASTITSTSVEYAKLSTAVSSTIAAGSMVSVAVWCNDPLTMYVDNNDSISEGTFEYSSSSSNLPHSLPYATESLPYSPDFWAYNEGQSPSSMTDTSATVSLSSSSITITSASQTQTCGITIGNHTNVCAVLLSYSQFQQIVGQSSSVQHQDGAIILVIGSTPACTSIFYFLPNATYVEVDVGSNPSASC